MKLLRALKREAVQFLLASHWRLEALPSVQT